VVNLEASLEGVNRTTMHQPPEGGRAWRWQRTLRRDLWDVCIVMRLMPASRSTPETDARVDQRFFVAPLHDTSDIDLHNAIPWWIMTISIDGDPCIIIYDSSCVIFCLGLKFLTRRTLATPFCGAVRIRPYRETRKNPHYQILEHR
jgi:hypothetical protein